MKALSGLIVIMSFAVYFLSDCEAFEPKTYIVLSKLQRVTTDAHINKKHLSRETLTKHDMLAAEVKGLIDDIIDEIRSGEHTDLTGEFKDITVSLEELQLYLERDKKQPPELEDVYPKDKKYSSASKGAYTSESLERYGKLGVAPEVSAVAAAIEAVAKATEAAIHFIGNLTSPAIDEIKGWQRDKETIKNDRIDRLEGYKWKPIYES